MEYLTNLMISIAGGLIVTLLLLLVSPVRRSFVNFFARDTKVGGEWVFFEGSTQVGILKLKQYGRNLSGTLSRDKSKDGREVRREYALSGDIHSDLISLTFIEHGDERRRGVICLVVGQVNDTMYGRNVYINISTRVPTTDFYTFIKTDSRSNLTSEDIIGKLPPEVTASLPSIAV